MTQLVNAITKITRTDDQGNTLDLPAFSLAENSVYARSKPLDFGQPRNDKYIDAVRCDLDADTVPAKLFIQIGYQHELVDPIVYTDKMYFTTLNELFTLRVTGRYITFYIEDELPTESWRLTSIEFLGRISRGRV